MTLTRTTPSSAALDRKPRDDEIDVYGLTHPGKVRTENQDHFLICALKKQVVVHLTSLPDTDRLLAEPERLAFLAMVADGVGGGAKGAEASQMALQAVTQYVTNSMRCYYAARSADDQTFSAALQEGARQCHEDLVRRGQEDPAMPGHGDHTHAVPRRLASGLPPPCSCAATDLPTTSPTSGSATGSSR